MLTLQQEADMLIKNNEVGGLSMPHAYVYDYFPTDRFPSDKAQLKKDVNRLIYDCLDSDLDLYIYKSKPDKDKLAVYGPSSFQLEQPYLETPHTAKYNPVFDKMLSVLQKGDLVLCISAVRLAAAIEDFLERCAILKRRRVILVFRAADGQPVKLSYNRTPKSLDDLEYAPIQLIDSLSAFLPAKKPVGRPRKCTKEQVHRFIRQRWENYQRELEQYRKAPEGKKEPTINVASLSDILGVSRSTVYRQLKILDPTFSQQAHVRSRRTKSDISADRSHAEYWKSISNYDPDALMQILPVLGE